MTNLETSPVTRRTTVTYKGRRIIITLRPDDVIELRLERKSDSLKIPIYDLLYDSARWQTMSIPQRKK